MLINLRERKKLPDSTYQEPSRIAYFTTPDSFLNFATAFEYFQKLAILNHWAEYSDFSITVIPKGARLQAMIGMVREQNGEGDQWNEIVKTLGKEQSELYAPKEGGGSQIYIAYVSNYDVFDLGPLTQENLYTLKVEKVEEDNNNKRSKEEKESKFIYLPIYRFLSIPLKKAYSGLWNSINYITECAIYKNPFSLVAFKEPEKQLSIFKTYQKFSVFQPLTSHYSVNKLTPYNTLLLPRLVEPKALTVLKYRPKSLMKHPNASKSIVPFVLRCIRL